jgi:hypothetical protein
VKFRDSDRCGIVLKKLRDVVGNVQFLEGIKSQKFDGFAFRGWRYQNEKSEVYVTITPILRLAFQEILSRTMG